MERLTRKKLSELLLRFAIFSITSGVGTLVDLGVHWWLSATFHTDSYLWRFWIAPIISFELAVLTNFLIAYYFVWRERISERTPVPSSAISRATTPRRPASSASSCW